MYSNHMVMNALAGAAVGSACGLTHEEIRRGIESIGMLSGHFRISECGDITLIDDSYNASPMSVRAALDVLSRLPGEKLAILGDMGELGKNERRMHREVGQYAGTCGAGRFITVGELSKETAAGIKETAPEAEIREFATVDELLGSLGELIRPGDSVLVKASHFMKFDRISKALQQRRC